MRKYFTLCSILCVIFTYLQIRCHKKKNSDCKPAKCNYYFSLHFWHLKILTRDNVCKTCLDTSLTHNASILFHNVIWCSFLISNINSRKKIIKRYKSQLEHFNCIKVVTNRPKERNFETGLWSMVHHTVNRGLNVCHRCLWLCVLFHIDV